MRMQGIVTFFSPFQAVLIYDRIVKRLQIQATVRNVPGRERWKGYAHVPATFAQMMELL